MNREIEQDQNEIEIDVEQLDIDTMADNVLITEGRHEVCIEKLEKITVSGKNDVEFDVKPFKCVKYRAYFRIIENGVKSEIYHADTFNRALIVGLSKMLKAQNTKFCEIEIDSHTYTRISKSGREYDAKCWDLVAVFPIDEMSIDALKGAW